MLAVPKASMTDPTEICCVLIAASTPWPKKVTKVLGPTLTIVVPGTSVAVVPFWVRVASSIPNVLPLRADTVPDKRAKPTP